MVMDALTITTGIAVLLFVGLICSWVSRKINIPDVLLLIGTGIFFGRATYHGEPLIVFPEIFMTSMGILALAMIVFDSTVRLRLREFDTFSIRSLKLSMISTLLIIGLFSAAAHFILNIPIWLSILFATIVAGTSPDILLSIQSPKKLRTLTMLKLESVFNTPLTVLLPFIVIDLMQNVQTELLTEIIDQLVPFVMKLIVGIGAGVFVGLILFKLIHRIYAEVYSPLAVIVAVLLAYVVAENLGGSGVLSVTALGLFFGNVYIKEKSMLLNIESVLTKALFIFVFLSVGLVIKIPLTKEFMLTSLGLFGAYLLVRFVAVWLSTHAEGYTFGEKLFMTLNIPKGIATAAVVFILAVLQIEGLQQVLDLTLTFVLYSIIISSIVTWGSSWFHPHEKRHR